MSSNSSVSPQLFAHPVLERLSRVKPWMPILFWGPIVVFLYAVGFRERLAAGTAISLIGSGLLVWTLTEYSLHRFLFHWEPRRKLARRFVFLMHGVHHDFPNDPDRLLMPPTAAILFAVLFGLFFRALLGPLFFPTFFAAFLTGYLFYDYSHFAAHYSDAYGRIFPKQKKRHMMHHFVTPDEAFGVSSPLWDRVFRT